MATSVIRLNIGIPTELAERLAMEAQERAIPQTKIICEAIAQWLARAAKQ